MKKNCKSYYIILLISVFIFFGSMFGFIVNACTSQDVTLAWVLFALIMIGSTLMIVGFIVLIVSNKERIKKYLNEIIK